MLHGFLKEMADNPMGSAMRHHYFTFQVELI